MTFQSNVRAVRHPRGDAGTETSARADAGTNASAAAGDRAPEVFQQAMGALLNHIQGGGDGRAGIRMRLIPDGNGGLTLRAGVAPASGPEATSNASATTASEMTASATSASATTAPAPPAPPAPAPPAPRLLPLRLLRLLRLLPLLPLRRNDARARAADRGFGRRARTLPERDRESLSAESAVGPSRCVERDRRGAFAELDRAARLRVWPLHASGAERAPRHRRGGERDTRAARALLGV